MEYLLEEFGGLPFHCDQIARLIRRSALLIDDLASGSPFKSKDIVRMIDMLQAILNMTFHACALVKFVPETRPEHPRSDWDVRISPDFERALSALPVNLLELKDVFFERLGLQNACIKPHPDGASVCHHCNFALERISQPAHPLMQRDIIDGIHPDYLLEFDPWPNLPALSQRAEQGCEFCDLICKALRSLPLNPHESEAPVLVSLRFLWWRDNLSGIAIMLYEGVDPTGASTGHKREFYIESSDDVIVSTLHLNQAPRKTPLDPANIAFIQKTLHASTASNSFLKPSTFVPKRLIDLGPSPDSLPVLITPNGQTRMEYATLSYCWGPPEDAAKQLKTTADTFEKHQGGIPLDTMSPVIFDTISVCRAFNIRYLWIDALCIIQGDANDWEEQSAQMSEIYGNTYLTVCPISSNTCQEGFLGDRPDPVLRLGFAAADDSSVAGCYSLRPGFFADGGPSNHTIDSLSPSLQDLVLATWSQRGWVYQEKCLSPRKLYFGKNQIHIQVGDKVTSENGYTELVSKQESRMHREWPKDVTMEYLLSHQRPIDYWYELAEQVALLNWTVRTDLFPSISGLASRFQKVIGCQYLAGIWAQDLHTGLLWIQKSKKAGSSAMAIARPQSLQQLLDELKNERQQVGPSWSWASHRSGRLEFLMSIRTNYRCRIKSHLKPEFTIIESSVQVDGTNPFGRLRATSLRISGKIISSNIEEVKGRSQHLISRGEDGTLALILADWGDQNNPSLEINSETRQKLLLLLVSSCCSDPIENDPAQRPDSPRPFTTDSLELQLHRVYKARYSRSFHDQSPRENCEICQDKHAQRDAWGLLLHPAHHPDTFYRIGVFISRAEHGGTKLFDGLQERNLELL